MIPAWIETAIMSASIATARILIHIARAGAPRPTCCRCLLVRKLYHAPGASGSGLAPWPAASPDPTETLVRKLYRRGTKTAPHPRRRLVQKLYRPMVGGCMVVVIILT